VLKRSLVQLLLCTDSAKNRTLRSSAYAVITFKQQLVRLECTDIFWDERFFKANSVSMKRMITSHSSRLHVPFPIFKPMPWLKLPYLSCTTVKSRNS